MKKLIAKTTMDKRYIHSKENAFFVSANAKKIVNVLNDVAYKLKDGECWHIYDYDFMQDTYVTKRIFMNKKGEVKVRGIA